MSYINARLADLNISFDKKIKNVHVLVRNYLCEFEKPDLILSVTEDEVKAESTTTLVSPGTIQRRAAFRKLAGILPEYNAFVFHSACFDVEGTGVAFAALSGTGKSTHMRLWQELLGDKLTVVNGDKPFVRFLDSQPEKLYAYGTPWSGKENLNNNIRTELKHICFIERSQTNYVERVQAKDVIDRLLKQVYIPQDPAALMKTIKLANRALSCCDFWIIHCNTEPEAAVVAYNKIFANK